MNRRKNAKLILMYKILNGKTPTYLKDLIPPQVQVATAYTLRNRTHFRIPPARTQLMNHSYIPATLRQWNALDHSIRSSRTLVTFKLKFKFKPHILTKLYSTSFGPSSKYHTQIRLGLSKLKFHLFTHNIIPDPACENCQTNTKETTMHYMLECPAFAAHREEMFRGLRVLLPPTVINSNTKLLQILIHGMPTAPLNLNKSIFLSVHDFIANSLRFSQQ